LKGEAKENRRSINKSKKQTKNMLRLASKLQLIINTGKVTKYELKIIDKLIDKKISEQINIVLQTLDKKIEKSVNFNDKSEVLQTYKRITEAVKNFKKMDKGYFDLKKNRKLDVRTMRKLVEKDSEILFASSLFCETYGKSRKWSEKRLPESLRETNNIMEDIEILIRSRAKMLYMSN